MAGLTLMRTTPGSMVVNAGTLKNQPISTTTAADMVIIAVVLAICLVALFMNFHIYFAVTITGK